jgi:hypothetical protein
MKTLSEDTFVYKYMSLDSFLFVLTSSDLLFQRVRNWPDRYEGFWFEFCIKNGILKSDSIVDNYYGSCWCLQKEDERFFDKLEDYYASQHGILQNGSSCMWGSYCINGGVRIRSSIGKICNLLKKKNLSFIHGEIKYENIESVSSPISGIEDLLFRKSSSFREEKEYRFYIKKEHEESVLKIKTNGIKEIIDEILICPNINSDAWKSRSIFRLVVDYLIDSTKKYDRELLDNIRISGLYSSISEEVNEIGEL